MSDRLQGIWTRWARVQGGWGRWWGSTTPHFSLGVRVPVVLADPQGHRACTQVSLVTAVGDFVGGMRQGMFHFYRP
jgi:hypothetical protein